MASEVEEQVERSIDLPADADEAWRLVTGAGELARWLGDEVELTLEPDTAIRIAEGGREREGVVDDVDPGRRRAFRWWPVEDETRETRVEISVSPLEVGSRVAIVETGLVTVGIDASAFGLLAAFSWTLRLDRLPLAVGLVCRV